MRRLFFSGLALLIGAPAGWIITQEAPQNNEASAPQDAAASEPPASAPTAPLPPTAPNPPLKGAVLPKVEYDIANDPFGGRFFVPRYPSGNDALRSYVAGVRRTNTDPNEAKARQLAAQIRATEDESARKAILVELEALTDDSFETMMRSRREQLAKAGQRLDELVERLEERQQLKSEIVKRRVAELLDQPDPLSWETPADFLAVDPPARFPSARTSVGHPYLERRAGGYDSFGGGSGGAPDDSFDEARAGGYDSFGGGSGGAVGLQTQEDATAGGAGSFGGGSGGGTGAVGYRGPADRLPARNPQESELARLQAELAAGRAQLAAQNAALQEQLRAIELLQAQAEEQQAQASLKALEQAQLKALEKERAKFEQDSND